MLKLDLAWSSSVKYLRVITLSDSPLPVLNNVIMAV